MVAMGEVLHLVGWLLLAGQVALSLGLIGLGLVISLVIKTMAGE